MTSLALVLSLALTGQLPACQGGRCPQPLTPQVSTYQAADGRTVSWSYVPRAGYQRDGRGYYFQVSAAPIVPPATPTPKVEPTKPAVPAWPAPKTVVPATGPPPMSTAPPNGVDMHDVEAQVGPVLTNDPNFAAHFIATTPPPAAPENRPVATTDPQSITPKVTVTMPDLAMPAAILGGLLCVAYLLGEGMKKR